MTRKVAITLQTPVKFPLHLKKHRMLVMVKIYSHPALRNGFLALILGMLLTLSFAPYGIYPLALLAPAGLLYLWVKSSSLKATFWLGYFFGLGLFGTSVYWIFISIHDIGGVPVPLSVLITVGMIAILSLYPALTGYCLNRFFPINQYQKFIFAFPAMWLLFEWLRGVLFTGFPWLFIGYSQTNSLLIGYAPILGVYGVSLAILMSSGLLVTLYHQRPEKISYFPYRCIALIILIWGVGGLLSLIQWTKPEGKPISVALVQGNIEQTIKWSPEHIELSLDRYYELTKPLFGKVDLIIWPETAIPLPLQNETAQDYINALDSLALATKTQLILGIPIMSKDGTGYYNSLVTLGDQKLVYFKRHLVPFGEYTPFSSILTKTLQFMDIPMSDLIPGSDTQSPLAIGKWHILPSICHEIAFPDLIRNPDPNINFLLVATNDAWFGDSNAEPLHLQMAAMRALEFKKPVLFVSNDGITAIISPNGKIEKTIPQRQAGILIGTIQPRTGITPWLRYGSDSTLIIIFCFLYAAYQNKLSRFAKKHKRDTSLILKSRE